MPSIHLRHPAAKGRVADRPVRAWRRFSLLPKNVTLTTAARTAAVVIFRNGNARTVPAATLARRRRAVTKDTAGRIMTGDEPP